MELPEQFEQIEFKPTLLFKVTLMRHEKPYYRDEGHDLTPDGVKGATSTGKRFASEGVISENDEIILLHSPKARAKGTLDFVAQGANVIDKPQTSIDQLRSSDMTDFEKFMNYFKETGGDMEVIANDHYNNPLFEERPEIIEPHSHKKDRLYRAFEYLIRWFNKHPAKSDKVRHVVAVSHFEVITHIIDDVFGIKNIGRYNAPSFGEAVHIEAFDTENIDKVKLKVTYDNQTRVVHFDRVNRSIILE